VETVLRTHSDEEAELLRGEHVTGVFIGEHVLAQEMARCAIERIAGRDVG
jgi:CPA2 family monovalent cation:H+ antiporter-2